MRCLEIIYQILTDIFNIAVSKPVDRSFSWYEIKHSYPLSAADNYVCQVGSTLLRREPVYLIAPPNILIKVNKISN